MNSARENRRPPRVLVCGTGVAGSALAALLNKRLGCKISLTVTERAERIRDQGYGLDLDSYGQLCLARAGLYDHYWEISKVRSDSMAMYPMHGNEPQFVYFRPNFLRKWLPSLFGAQPESNRQQLRDLFLESLHCPVEFERGAHSLEKLPDGSARVRDKKGDEIGEFDLVIDATGVHSSLRPYRIDDPVGKHMDMYMMIHGVVSDPEETVDAEFLKRFSTHGTIFIFGRGYFYFVQRFGPKDRRMAFLYYVPRTDETSLFHDIGIDPTSSRKDGIMTDERLDKVREWICRDMGDKFDPCYADFVRKLDRVTIRPNVTHGLESKLKEDCDLPLICIGDALVGCGIGGGGNLALKDANDLCLLMENPKAFNPDGSANLDLLKSKEAEWMKLKMDWLYAKEIDLGPAVFTREPGVHNLKWQHMWPNKPVKRFFLSNIFKLVAKITCIWFKHDISKGIANSHPKSPHFPHVIKAAEEAKTYKTPTTTR